MYRKLNAEEIEQLKANGCLATDWQQIDVAIGFTPQNIHNTYLSGYNRIGICSKKIILPTGEEVSSGIYNARLYNTIVGNEVYIYNISSISNYEIGDNTFIENTGEITYHKGSSAGVGIMVSAVNENGRRAIPIFCNLTAQIAHIMAFYRDKKDVVKILFSQIQDIANRIKAKNRGLIGKNTLIRHCNSIIDVVIGDYAKICGADLLSNGTIVSDQESKTEVGIGVIAKDFIFSKSAKVTDKAYIERSFVGQSSIITQGFTAIDSLIFANCEFANGEAVSMFASPHTISHHKSSLAIACALSFANLGSGTNMSNHAYKLGAIHQSVAERGCKFGSNSYILSPTHIGAFTMVLGSHKNHPDTHLLPFSYLIEENGESVLIPAVNLFRIGTLRDVEKWKKRDKRTFAGKLDNISYDFLNPYIINKITIAIKILKDLENQSPDAKYYNYGNCKIHRHSLRKAIGYYQEAIDIFIGENIVRLQQSQYSNISKDVTKWVDMAGQILPKIELGKDIEQISTTFANIHKQYHDYSIAFAKQMFDINNEKTIKQRLEQYISTLDKLKTRLQKESTSEFFGNSQIGYGIDYDESLKADFFEVIGDAKSNSFLAKTTKDIENKIDITKKLL